MAFCGNCMRTFLVGPESVYKSTKQCFKHNIKSSEKLSLKSQLQDSFTVTGVGIEKSV
jgi:hypothetical protein